MPNEVHADVFIYHIFPFRTRKSKNVRKVLNRISAVTVTISISLFYASFIPTEIGHRIVFEDLGLDLRFAYRRFEISEKNWDLRFDHIIKIFITPFITKGFISECEI